MVNSQLVQVIKKLSRNDLREISLFLESGFINRGHFKTDTVRLFGIICQAYPACTTDQLEKEKVYNTLFPGFPIVKGKLEKVISELNRLVRDYLLWKHYQSEPISFTRALHWSEVLRELSLNERYEQNLVRIEKEFLDNAQISPQQYFHRFLLEYDRHFWMNSMNTTKKDVNLSKTLESLSVFFEIYRIELLNRLLIQQKVANFETSPAVQSSLKSIFNLVPEDANLILKISSQIFRLLQKGSPSIEEFSDLMEVLREHESEIHPEVLAEYYTYLRNFCIFLINADHVELIPVLHQLQQNNLARGYLYVEGKLIASTYGSITKMAIMASNFDWAMDFVESHKNKVIGETDDLQFYHINKAQCLFAKKQFQAALDILPPTSENAMYYLLARRLEVMCYYELHADNIIGKIEAFKMLIRRASEKFLSPALRDVNNAFANILYQIVLSPKGDKKRAALIEERIKAKKELAESRWLLAKVKELQGKIV